MCCLGFFFQIQKVVLSIVTYQKYKDSRDWNPAGLICPHHLTITYIHDDLIIGKTVLVQTKTFQLIGPCEIWETLPMMSTLFQATVWCPLTSSHYLRQCCLRSILLNDITRPQWVNKYNVNRMINYACLIYYALGNLQAYITISICTVRKQYDISYEHCNEGTIFDQLSILVIVV